MPSGPQGLHMSLHEQYALGMDSLESKYRLCWLKIGA